MKGPESYEKDDICQYLDSIGAWYFRPLMAGYGKSGVPDIIACIAGKFWGIEVKRDNRGPTKLQQKRMEEIAKANGHAVCGPAGIVIQVLDVWRSNFR